MAFIVRWYDFAPFGADKNSVWSGAPILENSFGSEAEAQAFAQSKFDGDGSTAVHEDSLGFVLDQGEL